MIGEAGFENPQDCRVRILLKTRGRIRITLHSEMEKMFGKTIRQTVKEELEVLGIKHAEVEIFDFGSLDFVIRARIKTAAGRAGSGKNA